MKNTFFRLTKFQRQICCAVILAVIIFSIVAIKSNHTDSDDQNDAPSQEVILQIPDDFIQDELSLSNDEFFVYKSYGNKSCAIISVSDRSITTAQIPTKSPQGDIVIEIASNAFEGCDKLTSVTISESIKEIASDAFVECDNLIAIMTNSSNTKFCSVGGVLLNKDKTELLCYPANRIGKNYLLSTNIKRIGSYAFYKVNNLELILYEGNTEKFEEIYVALGNEPFEKMPVTCNYVAAKS